MRIWMRGTGKMKWVTMMSDGDTLKVRSVSHISHVGVKICTNH